jgi:hypothetical protein
MVALAPQKELVLQEKTLAGSLQQQISTTSFASSLQT